MSESDDDLDDEDDDFLDANADSKAPNHTESDDDVVESDIELEGETVEPDNDPPQKVAILGFFFVLDLYCYLCP